MIRVHCLTGEKAERPWSVRLSGAVLGSLVFLLVQSAFAEGLRTYPAGFYFWVLIGLLMAVINMASVAGDALYTSLGG